MIKIIQNKYTKTTNIKNITYFTSCSLLVNLALASVSSSHSINESRSHQHSISAIQKTKAKNKPWTEKEDQILRNAVEKQGPQNWDKIAKFLSRTAKQCSSRWINHLDPHIDPNHSKTWTEYEDNLIIYWQSRLGNKWTAIARKLKGRTENDVRNRWRIYISKGKNPNPSVRKKILMTFQAKNNPKPLPQTDRRETLSERLPSLQINQFAETQIDPENFFNQHENNLIDMQPNPYFDFNSSYSKFGDELNSQ